jgi:hypothetical protein
VTGVPLRVEELIGRTRIPWQNLVVVVETGSTVHGLATGSGDLDLTAVWTETFRDLVIDTPGQGSRMLRTQPEGTRSGPGDIDMQVYSMRKFVSLAANGNPSVLTVLFAPADRRVVDNGFPADRLTSLVASKRAGTAHLGYLDSQLARWRDGKVKARVHRPELVEKYGWDVKYAAHAIRLGLQGAELLRTGRVTLPVPEPHRGRLLAVRAGEIPEVEALEWCVEVRRDLVAALDDSPLPREPDREAVAEFLIDWHHAHG